MEVLLSYIRLTKLQVWCYTSVIPAFGKSRQENQEFTVMLSYMRPCLKKKLAKKKFLIDEPAHGELSPVVRLRTALVE